MFASHAALNPTEKPLAINSIQTDIRNSNRSRNQPAILQSPKPSLTTQITNRTEPSIKHDIPSIPTFRSRNNNIIWININNNKTPELAHKPPPFATLNYQWKASRKLTQLDPPKNHSINLSLTSQPPEERPLTPQEVTIMEELDPLVFNPISIIDI
jgi:hypothetical protein